ncbi:arylsulfatase [soil metagenome]
MSPAATILSRLVLALALLIPGLAAAKPPNIFYILLDDAGYGDLSCYGQSKFSTPNIDRLATEGMRFTQHYAGSTVCAPTRSVLMTGFHTGHTPVRGNREHQPVGQAPIPADTFTLAEALKGAGYSTGAFGKWGLGYPGSEGDPMRQGFDRFFGYNCQRNAHTYYPTWLYDDAQKIELDGQTYSHELIMEKALDWVRQQGTTDAPFFCYLPVTIPHAAMQVPDEDSDPFLEKFAEFNDLTGKYAGTTIKNPAAKFAGMMTRLDRDVGRLMALLKEIGADEDTLVMFSSDNGPHQEGGHMPEFFNSSGGFRGHKRDLFEGGIRVPFLARWPGKIEAGSTSDHLSAHWDIFPTLCELAGTRNPTTTDPPTDGLSLVPTLLAKGTQERHPFLYWEFYEKGGKRAARMGQWKAIQLDLNKLPDPPILLFDLDSDPAETTDLADQHPDQIAQARQVFSQAHRPSDHWIWPAQSR